MKLTKLMMMVSCALMMSACIDDTKATKACASSGSAPECKTCCRGQGDRNYTFHYTSTTKSCMCEFSSR